jgi:transcriptional regulator with XRE-family HTH domain
MNQQKIGNFLKDLRKEKGITQEQVAEYFGVAGRTVSRWETGSNMPDLSMLVDIAIFYDVEVGEILDGERKKDSMNTEFNETLEKVADYTDIINAKSMRIGVLTMACFFIILIQISLWKELSPAPLVSMMCAYNGATFIGKIKYTKDKTDLFIGVLFFISVVINTVAFILK